MNLRNLIIYIIAAVVITSCFNELENALEKEFGPKMEARHAIPDD